MREKTGVCDFEDKDPAVKAKQFVASDIIPSLPYLKSFSSETLFSRGRVGAVMARMFGIWETLGISIVRLSFILPYI